LKTKNQIIRLHKIFYNFLNNDLFLLLFKNSKDSALSNITKQLEYDFTYLKMEVQKKQIEINGRRCELAYSKYNSTIDQVKTKRALPANIIQARDAELAVYLLNKVECLAIHDAFLVSIYDLGLLIDSTNAFFQQKLNYTSTEVANPFSVL
jgi:hypothetical protein